MGRKSKGNGDAEVAKGVNVPSPPCVAAATISLPSLTSPLLVAGGEVERRRRLLFSQTSSCQME